MSRTRRIITPDHLVSVKKAFKTELETLKEAGNYITINSEIQEIFSQAIFISFATHEDMPEVYNVQVLWNKRNGKRVLYANTGDTYDTTILLYISDDMWSSDTKWQMRLGSWGDLVESGVYGI